MDPEADREDLALAARALEEYGAEGIEGTVPYIEYRAKRLGDRRDLGGYDGERDH